VRKRDADLGTLWEGVVLRYAERGLSLPWRWRALYRVVHAILSRGTV
jgi:hypothetical protein